MSESAESERHAAAARAWLEPRAIMSGAPAWDGWEDEIESLASLLAETAAAARRMQREADAKIASALTFKYFGRKNLSEDYESAWGACGIEIEKAIRAGDAAEPAPPKSGAST